MQEVTMTVQVPIELKAAFMERVREDNKPASRIMLELMHAYTKKEHIDEQERARRAKNVSAAQASVRLSGYEIPEFALLLDQLYIDGKITMQDELVLTRAFCTI
jgi:hypothetical protein